MNRQGVQFGVKTIHSDDRLLCIEFKLNILSNCISLVFDWTTKIWHYTVNFKWFQKISSDLLLKIYFLCIHHDFNIFTKIYNTMWVFKKEILAQLNIFSFVYDCHYDNQIAFSNKNTNMNIHSDWLWNKASAQKQYSENLDSWIVTWKHIEVKNWYFHTYLLELKNSSI